MLAEQGAYSSVKLTTVTGRPAYRFASAGSNVDGGETTIFADNGDVFTGLNAETALITVANSGFSPGRMERWLYNGLHSLDFQFMLQHRPLWDIVVILLSIIGLGFSVTSVIVGWRRLVT